MPVSITALSIVKDSAPRRRWRLLAFFDCSLPGVELKSCRLYLTTRDSLIAQGPQVDGPRGRGQGVTITDSELLAELRDAAEAAYLALGGSFERPDETAAGIAADSSTGQA